MKKNTNKILKIIITFLALVIIGLLIAILLELKNNHSSVLTEKTTHQNDRQITEQISETQTEPETTSGIDLSVFKKGIYTVHGKDSESIFLKGGVSLEIKDITETSVSFEYFVIQSPPANRIASIMIKDAKIEDGVAKFTFDSDGWFSRGKGTLSFTGNGKLKIRTQISHMNDGAMWSIGEGQHTLQFCKKKKNSDE